MSDLVSTTPESTAAPVDIRLATQKRGRGLFTTRAFQSGECIVRERAQVCGQFVHNVRLVGAACSHCMRTFEMAETSVVRYLDNPGRAQAAGALPLPQRERFGAAHVACTVPCQNACDKSVVYCSVACRDEAWSQYHRHLCLSADASGALRELHALCAAKDELSEDAVFNPLWPLLIARMLAMERVVAEDEPDDVGVRFCHYCGQSAAEAGKLLRCAACMSAYYCSDICRKCDWRYHRPCSKEAPSTRGTPPRLRVFGRFAHAAPGEFEALQSTHGIAPAPGVDAADAFLNAPLQCHCETGVPEQGGSARVAMWRAQVDLLRRSALYTPALDALFTLPVYVRLWNVLTVNATGVAPQSLFLSYFFDVVRKAREDIGSVRQLVQDLKPITSQLEKHRARVESACGAGLFPLQSAVINHSCGPNVTFAYNQIDATVDVVALEPIAANLELFANYLSPAAQQCDTRTRRRILATQYLFRCECPLCRMDD
jgi:hypothetical protein